MKSCGYQSSACTYDSGSLDSRTESYGYDNLNRLTSVDYGDGQTQGYSFDAMGNRLTKSDSSTGNETYGYDAANRLISRTVGGYTHSVTSDANGNTLTDGSRTNIWDSQNRLVSCTSGASGSTQTSAFTYGSDGLRRRGTVTAGDGTKTRTDYVYDGTMMVEQVIQHFNSSGTALDSPTAITYLQGPSGPLYRKSSAFADPSWYVYDGLGSVVGEVDVNGNLTASKLFDVYGLTRSYSGTPTTRQGFVGQLGHESDDETCLIYMRARYYDPGTGRFISQDPGLNGTNWFVYTSDNPVSRVDCNGRADQLYSWEVANQWIAGVLLTLGLSLIAAGLKGCALGYADIQKGQSLDLLAGANDGSVCGQLSATLVYLEGATMQISGACSLVGGVLEVILGASTVMSSYLISINSDEIGQDELDTYGNTPGRM